MPFFLILYSRQVVGFFVFLFFQCTIWLNVWRERYTESWKFAFIERCWLQIVGLFYYKIKKHKRLIQSDSETGRTSYALTCLIKFVRIQVARSRWSVYKMYVLPAISDVLIIQFTAILCSSQLRIIPWLILTKLLNTKLVTIDPQYSSMLLAKWSRTS